MNQYSKVLLPSIIYILCYFLLFYNFLHNNAVIFICVLYKTSKEICHSSFFGLGNRVATLLLLIFFIVWQTEYFLIQTDNRVLNTFKNVVSVRGPSGFLTNYKDYKVCSFRATDA